MEPKYIISVVALGLFFVLFLIFFLMLARHRKMEARLQEWLYSVYSDKNLVKKMDYDTAAVDEELSALAEKRSAEIGSASKKSEEVQLKIEDAFGKIEIEGIEEITGNYNPQ